MIVHKTYCYINDQHWLLHTKGPYSSGREGFYERSYCTFSKFEFGIFKFFLSNSSIVSLCQIVLLHLYTLSYWWYICVYKWITRFIGSCLVQCPYTSPHLGFLCLNKFHRDQYNIKLFIPRFLNNGIYIFVILLDLVQTQDKSLFVIV